MSEKITIRVARGGESTTLQVEGIAGSSCLAASEAFRERLGEEIEFTETEEMHMNAECQQQVYEGQG